MNNNGFENSHTPDYILEAIAEGVNNAAREHIDIDGRNEAFDKAITEDIMGLDLAQKAIQKAERTKLIWELLLDTLGLTYENPVKDVLNAMKDTQYAYNQAVKEIETILKMTQKS